MLGIPEYWPSNERKKKADDVGCPPVHVRGDNQASGLSYVQVDKHDISIYTTYISVDIAHHEIFRA